ncbi:MAG: universal stress protein, partial [Halolamina sp.]
MNAPPEDAEVDATEGAEPTPESLAVDTVLVPVDGSEESVRAVEYGVAVADRYDAEVHVLYVLGEDLVRAIEEDVIDETAIADDAQAFVEDATVIGEDAGVETTSSMAYGFTTRRISQHPGSVILDTAEEVDADFLVVPREAMSDERCDVLEKAAQYVLSYASQPVLSV